MLEKLMQMPPDLRISTLHILTSGSNSPEIHYLEVSQHSFSMRHISVAATALEVIQLSLL